MLIIRPARPEEHSHLEALLRRASLATGEHVQELLDNPEAMNLPAESLADTLVAEKDGTILGFCTVLLLSKTVAEIDAVFIDPPVWRRGLGRDLVAAATRKAAVEGVTSLGVVSGRYARPFYASLGFEQSGLETTRFGPALRMTKALPEGAAPPRSGAA